MALPTSNIDIIDVATVLIGGILQSPIKMGDLFTNTAINKYGLSPTYVSGADADARLVTLQTTPYKLGHFRAYYHSAAAPSFNAAVFIDVGTLVRGEDVNGTITVYKTSDNSQVGLAVQVNAITSDAQYNFYSIPEEYYIVWNLTKRLNGTPVSTSISWTETLTSTNGTGTNSGNWNATTDFDVFIT